MSRFSCYGYVDPEHPEAAGICDRGGEARKLRDLLPEMEYRGGRLVPNGFRVCRHHMDVPNPQDGGQFRLKRDPAPVANPRPDIDGIANVIAPFTPGLPEIGPAGPALVAIPDFTVGVDVI